MLSFANKFPRILLAAGAIAIAPIAVWAETHQVSIQGFAFSPATLTVAAGDTIVFTNMDSAPHTATANDGSFDTGRLGNGDSAEITIAAAGTMDYICAFHPSMKGQVTAN